MSKHQSKTKRPAAIRSDVLLGAAIRKSVKRQVEESANTIAREVADWIAEDGVLDVKINAWGIDVWVNGDPVKEIKWANILEDGINDDIHCGCHKEMPKEFAALSAKLKRAAKLIDAAIAPNDELCNVASKI